MHIPKPETALEHPGAEIPQFTTLVSSIFVALIKRDKFELVLLNK